MTNLTISFRSKEDMEDWLNNMNEIMDTDRVFQGYWYRQFDSIDKKNEKQSYKMIRKGGE